MIALTYLPSVSLGADSSNRAFDIFSAVRGEVVLEVTRGIVEVLRFDRIENIRTGDRRRSGPTRVQTRTVARKCPPLAPRSGHSVGLSDPAPVGYLIVALCRVLA